VTRPTTGLPVRPIPKELLIAFVRDDVIDDGCCGDASFARAFHLTERMLDEEEIASSLPLRVVTALSCCPTLDVSRSLLDGLSLVLEAVAAVDQSRAARLSTRFLRTNRHEATAIPQKQKRPEIP
jgi:hypothetical protein